MDSSGSDGSFAWTNASSDSSDNSSLKVNMTNKRGFNDELVNSSDSENDKKEYKKAKKRKVTSDESSPEVTTRKRIKTEPDSDSKKHKAKIRKNRADSSNRNSDTDDYLNIRVKEEHKVYEDVKFKKEKKKKRLAEAEINASVSENEKINENSSYNHENDLNIESSMKPKKEKKNKRSKEAEYVNKDEDECVSNTEQVNGNTSLDDKYDIEEKITVEDTIITKAQSNCVEVVTEERGTHKKKKKKDRKSLTFDEANNSQTDSVNISAIDNNRTEIEHTNSEFTENGCIENQDNIIHNKSRSNNSRRISNRITFEDDNSDMDISTQTNSSKLEKSFENKTSKQMDLYIKSNHYLQTIKHKIDQNTIISNDDEVWVFRCPREIDLSLLNGLSLNLESKCKIKISGKNYEAILEEDKLQLPIFTYNFSNKTPVIKNIKVSGCINLKRRIPKTHAPGNEEIIDNQTDCITLPETKCRHPLFGVNYKKYIKIPADVQERLKADRTVEPDEEVKKKKKKHKKEKRKLDLETELEVPQAVKLEVEPVSKKKKKRKHTQVEDSPPIKAKRIKHDPDCAETWESEKAIEETLFNF